MQAPGLLRKRLGMTKDGIGPFPLLKPMAPQSPGRARHLGIARPEPCPDLAQALRLGYRHIDTAEMYDNERDVGDGVRASGVKRNDLFVTTKIWPTHFAPRALERATLDCLRRLRLSEVDLLLLHWPNPQIPLSETSPRYAR